MPPPQERGSNSHRLNEQPFTFNSTNTGITIDAGDGFAHTLGNTANGAAAKVVLQGDLTVTHNGTKTYTIASPITGAFSLIKDGSGPLTIVGDSTYSGGTLIKNGSLLGTTVDTMLGTGDVTMGGAGSSGATLTTNRSPANNSIITAPDSGTIIVGNNSTTSAPIFSGAFTLNGDLTLRTQAAATTGALTLTGGVTGTGNLTFNNNMDESTVDASDFGNAASATVTIGTVTETIPGVFLVEATPTTGGTLQLQVNAGAVLKDSLNNNVDTTSAIVDNTTLAVDTTAPTLSGSEMSSATMPP
jgi:autotransporter-associated beta strand protein